MNQQEYNQRTSYRTGRRHLNKKNTWHCVYHPRMQRPIAVSLWLHTINTLCQHEPNLVAYYSINKKVGPRPSMIGDKFSTMKPWESQWDNDLQKFVKTPNMNTVPIEDRFYARIVAEKSAALDKINYRTNLMRKYISSDLVDQSWIYEIKRQQAELVLKHENPADTDPQWSTVYDHALTRGYNLKTAAQSIIVQSNSYQQQMLVTESIRSKYVQFILDCQEMYEVLAVMEDFYRETFIYY